MCPDWVSNRRPFTFRDNTHPTEPLRLGQWAYLKLIQLDRHPGHPQTQFLIQSTSLFHLMLLHLACSLGSARITPCLPGHDGQTQLHPDVMLFPFHGCGSPTSCPHALNLLFHRSRWTPWASTARRLVTDSNVQVWKPPLLYLLSSTFICGKVFRSFIAYFFFPPAFQREKRDMFASEKGGCQTNDDLSFASRVYKVSFCSH